jgi:hypothetical protein
MDVKEFAHEDLVSIDRSGYNDRYWDPIEEEYHVLVNRYDQLDLKEDHHLHVDDNDDRHYDDRQHHRLY